MHELLAEAGMTTADYAYLRQPRAAGRRWLGVDYYVNSEQSVRADESKVPAKRRLGLASLAGTYHARYGLPLFISETSRDTTDWGHALRVVRGGVDPIGPHRIDRSPHPVAGAFASLIGSVSQRRFQTSEHPTQRTSRASYCVG